MWVYSLQWNYCTFPFPLDLDLDLLFPNPLIDDIHFFFFTRSINPKSWSHSRFNHLLTSLDRSDAMTSCKFTISFLNNNIVNKLSEKSKSEEKKALSSSSTLTLTLCSWSKSWLTHLSIPIDSHFPPSSTYRVANSDITYWWDSFSYRVS